MINVLVIDDSAVMRSFLAQVIAAQPDMQLAGVVSDPLLGIERIRRAAPDVITLDVEMPRMNGLDFLRQLMAIRPLPVIMISSLTQQGADATFRALELGAVDFFPKPASPEELSAASGDIAEKIRAAAQARVRRVAAARAASAPPVTVPAPVRERAAAGAIIGIGASTGGVEALRAILTELPDQMPPILMAQHMLPAFTETFARRLDAISPLSVKLARDGEEALSGAVYVAPGGRHLELERRSGRYVLGVTDGAPINRHRPSVDVLFRSMARAAGVHAIGVLLTGMGADGAEGLLAMRQAGAMTLAQDEASSIVFGMPRQAIALGAAQEVVALGDVAARLRALTEASSVFPNSGVSLSEAGTKG